MTATGGAELEQLARATKAIIGFRLLFCELKKPQFLLGATPSSPTLAPPSTGLTAAE